MAGTTRITFAQDGQEPITFEISGPMMDKIYSKIDQINASPVLGQTVTGAADWWMKETAAKIISPLLEEFPDPDPAGIVELQAQIETLQAQIAQMKRDAFVAPVVVVPPEG
ncbi:MAG: hypothetical protein J0H49_10615 [Acidobacteria bacterium]|nr:hypothetical protein [Acidobacteriota bacterium]